MEEEKVEVENVVEKMELFGNLYNEFNNVFAQFSSPIKETTGCVNDTQKDDYEAFANDAVVATAALNKKKRKNDIDGVRLSHNTRKLQQRRMKIAKLKQKMRPGDVVEVWDATAAHHELLISLKSYRNSVPVPRHWCHKRKFLQGKVGIEKQPFRLPEFIAATGIKKIREAYIEKEDKSNKKLKQKQREKRMHPKMGSIDINYRVFEDEFFKYQTKPKLTAFGDVYYKGKEFVVELDREMKPGMLSELLKEALGMPEGAPPPSWLISMQRHGPPLSYPQLKIPGVNVPIPPGANFGYHPGGWGKAPVDEYARPLYGDVFGVQQSNHEEELVGNTKHWGDLEEKEEAEVEEQTEEEETDIQSFDSVSSNRSTGVGTPDVIDLRKWPRKEPEKYLYRVLEKKEEMIAPGTLPGTSHVYVIGSGTRDKTAAKGQKSDGVDVTLQPEELEVMENAFPAKYEEAREAEGEKLCNQQEDCSDMVAEYGTNRRQKCRKRRENSREIMSSSRSFCFCDVRMLGCRPRVWVWNHPYASL